MGKKVLKNWSPKDVVRFLKKNGFVEIKIKKGDHCGLYKLKTQAYTEVDMGRDAFTQREMMGFCCQAKISKAQWVKGKRVL